MSMEKIGVLGCGLMGAGIAQVCAQSGFKTIVRETDQKFIDNGFGMIEKNMQKAIDKGKISKKDKDAMWNRLNLKQAC